MSCYMVIIQHHIVHLSCHLYHPHTRCSSQLLCPSISCFLHLLSLPSVPYLPSFHPPSCLWNPTECVPVWHLRKSDNVIRTKRNLCVKRVRQRRLTANTLINSELKAWGHFYSLAAAVYKVTPIPWKSEVWILVGLSLTSQTGCQTDTSRDGLFFLVSFPSVIIKIFEVVWGGFNQVCGLTKYWQWHVRITFRKHKSYNNETGG